MASKDRQDARDEAAYLKEVERQKERLELEQIGGSNIVSADMKKEVRDVNAKRDLYQQGIELGMDEEAAAQLVKNSGIGSVTPNLDRWQARNNAQGKGEDLGGFKTYGDKSAFEAKNAVRKLQGLAPIAEPLPADQEFLVNLEKSASFGAESALVGDKAPKGQARAFEAGIRAGYSPEETRKLIADTAARITGVVDQQKEKQQFVSDFAEAGKGAVPQPVGMLTPVERTSAGLDKSFFGGLAKKENALAPVTPAPTTTTTDVQQPLFLEQVTQPAPASPPAIQPPVNPQNMTTAEGVVSAGMRGAVGGIPTPVLRQAMTDVGTMLRPLAKTAGFFTAADQLDYILGRKRNQK
jgi:hypothetical protein